MKTKFLSYNERKKGIKYFLISILFNGLGFSFISDTTVQLMAIHFGANNFHLGYINSIIYLSGIILVFTPYLLQGKNLIKIYFIMWLIRGLVFLFNGFTLLAPSNIALTIVLFSYTLFCSSRMVAVAMDNPIRQMISTPLTRGEIISKASFSFNITMLVGRIVSFVIVSMSFFTEILSLIFIQFTGVILNSLSAFSISKVPCREKVEITPGKNILALFIESFKRREMFIPLLLNWLYFSSLVLSGFVIALLKRIIDLPQSTIFLYTINTSIAILITLYASRPFIDRIGSKPIIAIISFVKGCFLLLWAFIKPATPLYLIFLLGFGLIGTDGILQPFIGKIIIQSIPQKNKINYNAMLNFFTGIFAFSTGMLAGYAGDIGEKYSVLSILNPYYIIFFLAAFLSFSSVFVSLFIKEKNSISLKETADIFLSVKNLRAFINSYTLDLTTDRQKRDLILTSLKHSRSQIATDEIKRMLNNPLSNDTEEVIKSLFFEPRPKLLREILTIAKSTGSYLREYAIFALGAYPDKEVEDELIKFLHEDNPLIQSTASKSLARIGNKDYKDKILESIRKPGNSTSIQMNYLIAIGIIDEENKYLESIFHIGNYKNDKSYKQVIFALISRMMDMVPQLNILYQNENITKGEGMSLLLEEAKQISPFYNSNKEIMMNYMNENYNELWQWCKNNLREHSVNYNLKYLAKGIIDYPLVNMDEDNTFAALYFTFQILSLIED